MGVGWRHRGYRRVRGQDHPHNYNHVHRHAGIGLHTPASVHYGTAREIRAQRAATLDAAYAANPARLRHRPPSPPKLPTVAWINEPSPEALIKSA